MNSFLTRSYKGGYIHCKNDEENKTIIDVQYLPFPNISKPTMRSAKIYITKTETNLVKLYLSYLNDFITLQGFADHHAIGLNEANIIIEKGRKLNES